VRRLAFSPDGSRLIIDDAVWQAVRDGQGLSLRRTPLHARGAVLAFRGAEEVYAGALSPPSPIGPEATLRNLSSDGPEVLPPNPGYAEVENAAEKARRHSNGSPLRLTQIPYFLTFGPDGKQFVTVVRVHCRGATSQEDIFEIIKIDIMELWDGVGLRRRAVWGASLEADATAEVIDRDSFDRPVLSATVIQFSPDGKRLAAATRKGLEVYSVADAEHERTLTPDAVACFAFSPDGEGLLAVRAEGKGATVFELSDGSVRAEWPAEPKVWACLCWSPDGKTVAFGGEDGLIRLWDPATGRELARWQAQESPVTALAYSPDGDFLVSGGRDGTLKVWNLPFIRKELAALGLDW
jgi:hypothetical protein